MQKIKLILLLAILGGGIYFVTRFQKEVSERKRMESNQEQLLIELRGLKTNLTSLEFDKKEFKDYLQNTSNQLNGLNDKLADQGIKLQRVNRIVSTQIRSVDTMQSKIILDSIGSIAKALANNVKIEIPFEDKTECFEFKAKFILEDGQSRIDVLSRTYNDTIQHVGYWERRKWKLFGLIPTKIFGKKIAEVIVFNNCGFSKTIVLEKK